MKQAQYPTLYLSVGLANGYSNYNVTPKWGWDSKVWSDKSYPFRAVVLNRSDPTGPPHLDKCYEAGAKPMEILQDISNVMGQNESKCILIFFASMPTGWEENFIDDFKNYGAGDLYQALIQEMLLLSGSGTQLDNVNYILTSIPIEGKQGHEVGNVLNDAVTMSFELIPLSLPSGTEYTLRLLGKADG